MKVLILALLLISASHCNNFLKEKISSNSNSENKTNVVTENKIPVNVNVAQVNGVNVSLPEEAMFRKVHYVSKLPINASEFLNDGAISTAEGTLEDKYYYDGRNKLASSIHINCNIYNSTPQPCVKDKGCGWCGENQMCLAGTPAGPLGNCARSSWIFNLPNKEWDPLRAASLNLMGVDKTGRVIVHSIPNPDTSTMVADKRMLYAR